MTPGRALADFKFALVPILLVQEEQRHPARVCLVQGVSHQELGLADESLLLRVLGINFDDFQDKRLHRDGDARTCLITHELEAWEVERLRGWVEEGLLVVREQRLHFAHDQFADFQE